MNFWQEMKNSHDAEASRDKPIICLAPMADVTDVAFRHIIAKYSKLPRTVLELPWSQRTVLGNFSLERIFCNSYVTYTEFVSADGLVRAPEEGRKKLLKDLEYSEIERPIVAQFFTSNPDHMYEVAKLAVELGFDGVDINMGCPDKSIEKQGAGVALIKNPSLARELIKAAKEGTQAGQKGSPCLNEKCGVIPVSVKTRLGYNKDELEEWLPELLAENPAAIIIHARTRKEMSKVPARWERIKRAVEIRNEMQTSPPNSLSLVRRGEVATSNLSSFLLSPNQGEGHAKRGTEFKTLIIGNGDVESVADAVEKCKKSGADGAMIGRGVFGNPWVFANYEPTQKEKLKALVEHTKLFEEKLGKVKSFAIMKKHFKAYLNGSNEKDLRLKLMKARNANEVEKIAKAFLSFV